MDRQQIKTILSGVDLVSFAGGNLKQSGRYFSGPCPMCGGRDRFQIKPQDHEPDLWICRSCAPDKYHDPADFIMKRDGVSFPEAMCVLSGGHLPPAAARPAQRQPKGATLPPDGDWQATAVHVIADCCHRLHSQQTKAAQAAYDYLKARGLTNETIFGASLGYNHKARRVNGLWIEQGITIPLLAGADVWSIKIRTAPHRIAQGIAKYVTMQGSKSKAVYGIDQLRTARTAVVTEGEFDALLLKQELADVEELAVVTMGASSNVNLSGRWAVAFAHLSRLLLAFDHDEAGQAAAEKWRGQLLPFAQLAPPLLGSDITEHFQSGNSLCEWFESCP